MNKRSFRRRVNVLLRDRYQAMPEKIKDGSWSASLRPDGSVLVSNAQGMSKLCMPQWRFERAMRLAGQRVTWNR